MTTSNVLIAAPIYSDAFTGNLYTPTVTGGSWEAGNPLTNLQDRRLHRVARSSNDARSSTLFTADLGANRPVRCVALVKHTMSDVSPSNGSQRAEVRVRGFTAPPIIDAGGDGYQPFLSGWTISGTPTRTANNDFATNGVFLDLIGDDDAAVVEEYTRAITYTGDGQKVVELYWKAGTSPSLLTLVQIRDTTASETRMELYIANNGGAPSLAGPTGTLLSSTSIGNGVYRLVFLSTSVTAANVNDLRIRPAADSGVLDTGNVRIGNVCTYNSATDPLVYDSGMVAAHPSGSTAEDRAGLNATFAAYIPTTATARYWRVNINDDNNPAGYVDIGRLVIAGGYQPTINMAPGASISLESDTTRTVSDGGAAIYDTRPLRRTARFSVINLPTSEAFTQAWRVQKHLGASTQCFVMLAPEASHAERIEQSFLATIRELSAIEYREAAFGNLSLAVVEEL